MKKRIFIINDIAAGGGAEIVMRDLINYLWDKYDITLMTLDDDSEGAKKLFGDKVRYLPSKIKANPYSRNNPLYFLTALYNKLRIAAIRKKRFDVAIANKEGPCMKIVSKMAAKKKIGWVHADYNLVYWTHFTYKEGEELQCMKEYDSIVCVSKAAEDGVRAVIGDQKRVMTPAAAKEIGSDYIVVGRPITAATDPVAAYERCVAEFCD